MAIVSFNKRKSLYLLVIVSIMLASVLSACGRRGSDGAESVDLFRQPHPTFTPTANTPQGNQPAPVQGSQPQIAPVQSNVRSAVDAQDAQPIVLPELVAEAPRAVVNAPLVNLRTEPSLTSEVVEAVERGSEYEITGRSADDDWWKVCCHNAQEIWVSQSYVDTIGDVDAVRTQNLAVDPVESAITQSATGGPAEDNTNAAQFELESVEQFSEQGLVRIYVYLYEGDNALSGYGLRILKDGREITADGASFGGQPAFTWPFQDARQRHQNLKIEVPGEPAAGSWSIQPINSAGVPVGPPAQFTLSDNDPNQELYARYKLIE